MRWNKIGPFGMLVVYHLVITYTSYSFTLHQKFSDVNKYWFIRMPADWFKEQHFPPFREYLLYYINYFPAGIWDWPLWLGFVIYSCISIMGFYLLYRVIQVQKHQSFYILLFIPLLLPSAHFWTSMIGKEPICFSAIAMVFYGIYKPRINYVWLIVGVLLLGLIRPHIAILLIGSLAIAWIFKRKTNIKEISIGLGLLVIFGVILLQSHWLQSFSLDSIQHLLEVHHNAFQKTDTYVPLEHYNLGYKWFTFNFRPYPGELSSTMGWLMGLENLGMLFLFFSGIIALIWLKVQFKYQLDLVELSFLLFFIILALVLSLAYSNYGLISRMKVQSIPFMLILCSQWIITLITKLKHVKT